MKKILLTLALGTFAQISFADVPSNKLLIARVAAIAYANNPSLDVYNAEDIVNGRPRRGAERYGAAAGAVMKSITGATQAADKEENERWANVRNPCSKVRDNDENSSIFECSVKVKYHNDEALVIETFTYKALVTNHDGASDYTATVLSDFVTRTRRVTEGQ